MLLDFLFALEGVFKGMAHFELGGGSSPFEEKEEGMSNSFSGSPPWSASIRSFGGSLSETPMMSRPSLRSFPQSPMTRYTRENSPNVALYSSPSLLRSQLPRARPSSLLQAASLNNTSSGRRSKRKCGKTAEWAIRAPTLDSSSTESEDEDPKDDGAESGSDQGVEGGVRLLKAEDLRNSYPQLLDLSSPQLRLECTAKMRDRHFARSQVFILFFFFSRECLRFLGVVSGASEHPKPRIFIKSCQVER